jgi:hypothetical protein
MSARILLVLFLLSSCSLFETRDVEKPGEGSLAVFLQPDRPEVVLDNLSSAIAGMSALNYVRSLDGDDFVFTPTVAAQQVYPDVFAGWDVASEENWFTQMSTAAAQSSGHQLTLTNITTEISSNTERQVVANYSLTVYHNRASQGVPNLVRGRFVLTLVSADNGLWSIREWSDISVNDEPSWSDLKALFTRN